MKVRRVRTRLAAGALAATLALAGAACEAESAGPETGADIEDVQQNDAIAEDDVADGDIADEEVFDDVESFVGETVTVSGEVTEVVSPTVFRLSGGEVVGEPLRVLSATGQQNLEEGQVAQVTGAVRVIDQDVFEEEPEFDDDFFTEAGFEDEEAFVTEFEGEHAIFADQVEVIEGGDADVEATPTG